MEKFLFNKKGILNKKSFLKIALVISLFLVAFTYLIKDFSTVCEASDLYMQVIVLIFTLEAFMIFFKLLKDIINTFLNNILNDVTFIVISFKFVLFFMITLFIPNLKKEPVKLDKPDQVYLQISNEKFSVVLC